MTGPWFGHSPSLGRRSQADHLGLNRCQAILQLLQVTDDPGWAVGEMSGQAKAFPFGHRQFDRIQPPFGLIEGRQT